MKCSECERYNIGINIFKALEWPQIECIMQYNKENQEIIIDEKRLMHLIQLVNPIQETRKIRLKGGEKD